MSTSVFTDKNRKPDEKILLKALKQTGQLWSGLRSILEEEYGPLIEEWKFYSAKSGWQLKLLRKKRNLFFSRHLTDTS